MEGKVAAKKLQKLVDERPYDTMEPSSRNILGSTVLSLSLNNSEQPPQIQGQPLTQMGLLKIKLEEMKKENQKLRAMINKINEHYYTTLQNCLLLEKQQQQLSSSSRDNQNLQKGSTQDEEKPVLPTCQFLNISEPLPSPSVQNIEKNIVRNIAHVYSSEGKINNQITTEGVKCIEDQSSTEVSCRKARVSIRAPSDLSMMRDGCEWRKYGQKTAKGNPYPRAYYRCNMGTACPVRKQVQRCFKDDTILITTYEGNHNHPLPPAATPMANSTSATLKMFLSGSTTSLYGTTLSNSHLFSSLSSTSYPTGLVTFSPSPTCPTVTLDLTQPTSNYLQFQKGNSSDHRQFFPLPILHAYTQTKYEGLYLNFKLPTMIPKEKNLAVVDVVSEAIAKGHSLKAALCNGFVDYREDSNRIPSSSSSFNGRMNLGPVS